MSKHYPEALCIEPMKINKIPDGKESMFPSICSGGEYFAELKKDGYWYQFEKTEHFNYLFSRNVSVETGELTEKSANVPHIIALLDKLPAGTILVGEVYYPNKKSKDVTPIMGSLYPKALERQQGEYGYLHYYVHDILYYNGVSLMNYGASIRYKILRAVFAANQINCDNYIELATRVDDNIQEFVSEALLNGEEGVVLKKKTAPYSPGKRPAWDTLKIKQTDTCDAICMGFCDPTQYYNGKLDLGINYTGADGKSWLYWILQVSSPFSTLENPQWVDHQRIPYGHQVVVRDLNHRTIAVTKAYYCAWKTSMRVGAYDENGVIKEIGTVSSGLTEALQQAFSERPQDYIGKVAELSGMEKDRSAHTLRHFYFKNFREDKDAKDCLIKEIF